LKKAKEQEMLYEEAIENLQNDLDVLEQRQKKKDSSEASSKI
jgi:hypothetical protein